jgi:rubredoxin
MTLDRPDRFVEVKCPKCSWVHAAIPAETAASVGAGSPEQLAQYFRCFNCGGPTHNFVPAQPDDAPRGCQQARKRLWQQAKRRTDYSYYQNQLEAQERWRQKNQTYWRQYREEHPDYEMANRELQRVRNARRDHRSLLIANSDTSSGDSLNSGTYRLVEVLANQRERQHEWLVHLTVISETPRR